MVDDEDYEDWDAAVAQRDPLRFKFMGDRWEITEIMDLREVAKISRLVFGTGDDEKTAEQIVDFIASHLPAERGQRFRDLYVTHKVSAATLAAGWMRIIEKDAGLPVKMGAADPLGQSPVSSPSSGRNGRSTGTASPKLVSATP